MTYHHAAEELLPGEHIRRLETLKELLARAEATLRGNEFVDRCRTTLEKMLK